MWTGGEETKRGRGKGRGSGREKGQGGRRGKGSGSGWGSLVGGGGAGAGCGEGKEGGVGRQCIYYDRQVATVKQTNVKRNGICTSVKIPAITTPFNVGSKHRFTIMRSATTFS